MNIKRKLGNYVEAVRHVEKTNNTRQKMSYMLTTDNFRVRYKTPCAYEETVQMRTIATTATNMVECKKGANFSIVCTYF